MRLLKTRVMVPLLALPLVTGAVIALPLAVPALAYSSGNCQLSLNFTNNIANPNFTENVPQPIMSKGSQGDCVAFLQYRLNAVGHWGLNVDGIFGKETYEAVWGYQTNHQDCVGSVDGIAGHYTMSCLVHGCG